MAKSTAIYYSPHQRPMPEPVAAWLGGLHLEVAALTTGEAVMASALRGRPRVVVIDARGPDESAYSLCRRVKSDSYTAVVPCVILSDDDETAFAAAFGAGADEVIRAGVSAAETRTRVTAMLHRSDRDLVVHPSTRLPGAVEIEVEVQRRLTAGLQFAMCYADLDHFKEFNDRYSYYDGDRVIRILAKILHDVVKGITGEHGFVGHIGGDDFIYVIPIEHVDAVCAEVVDVFDTLIPFQYAPEDRAAGHFYGKDRRGQLHRVPIMTVSIGVVTNARRVFTHAAQVSELATEMKSYAKTLPGSVYSIDRRGSGVEVADQLLRASDGVGQAGPTTPVAGGAA